MMSARRFARSTRGSRFAILVACLSTLAATTAAHAGGDALICNEPISAIPTDDGTCMATISFSVTNDGCGDYSCGPGLTQNGDTWSQTVGPGLHSYSCTSEESEDGNPACACEAQILVEDQERPRVGTPAAIDACFFTTTAAVDAGKAAVMPVATDNCAVDHIQLKTSEIDQTCRFVFSLVAVDAAGNESTPVTTFQTVVNGELGESTCGATKQTYEVNENCETTVVFTADFMDPCCVDIDSIRPMIKVESTDNMLTVFNPDLDCVLEYGTDGGPDDDVAGDDDTPPGVDLTKVHVMCAVRVLSLESCPCEVKFSVDARDCCGHLIDDHTCVATAQVVDRIQPEITCPPPLTLERGDKLCNSDIDEWLRSVKAEDNCGRQTTQSIFNGALLDLNIPDNDPNGVSHTFDPNGDPNILDLDVDLTIDHPNLADLTVKLKHGATEVVLIQHPGPPACGAGNYAGIILNDEAAVSIQDQCQNDLSTPPSYRPLNPLSAFDGMSFDGSWTITIIDDVAGNTGKLQRWSMTARSGVLIENDAPEQGFPPGTTTVNFTATDGCGNTDSCTSTVTVAPHRGVSDQKGSLLVFSKVEVKWDADGNLIQDTLLDVSNDADREGVEVQAYFINGDRQELEQTDMQGNLLREFEPGWNTADCRFHLTKNQPHFWSAARGSTKCQPFTVLDDDGPGRLDPEAGDGTRILRGFVVMWAVKFLDPVIHTVAGFDENEEGLWQEIRWNHLKGDAVIVNYDLGAAWEYNAVAYQARCGETGEPLLDCTLRKEPDGVCIRAAVIPGILDLDGFQYDINFDQLLLDFYASGSTALSTTGVGVMVDTDLTLHSMDVDVRQDGDGPILTKAEFEIFNQNESKFSGTRRCICCWDQTLLSNYVRDESVPNHFLRTQLRTDKGYARIDGVASNECDYFDICGIESHNHNVVAEGGSKLGPSAYTALAGVAFKILTFTGAGSKTEWAGGSLHGSGEQSSTILYDVDFELGLTRDAAPAAIPQDSRRTMTGKNPRNTRGQ